MEKVINYNKALLKLKEIESKIESSKKIVNQNTYLRIGEFPKIFKLIPPVLSLLFLTALFGITLIIGLFLIKAYIIILFFFGIYIYVLHRWDPLDIFNNTKYNNSYKIKIKTIPNEYFYVNTVIDFTQIKKQIIVITQFIKALQLTNIKIDNNTQIEIENMLKSIYYYNDLFSTFQLLSMKNLDIDTKVEYYTNLAKYVEKIEYNLYHIKELDIYKYYSGNNISKKMNELKIIKKQLEQDINLLEISLKEIEDKKLKEKILKHKTELISILDRLSELTISNKQLENKKILQKIKNDTDYIGEIKEQLKIIDNASNKINLLKIKN